MRLSARTKWFIYCLAQSVSVIYPYLSRIPLATIWDGCVSILRLYDPEELLEPNIRPSARSFFARSGRFVVIMPSTEHKRSHTII